MRITAKVDYAVRAGAELAAHAKVHGPRVPMKGDAIATAQRIPVRFLESILAELRRSAARAAEALAPLARHGIEDLLDHMRCLDSRISAYERELEVMRGLL